MVGRWTWRKEYLIPGAVSPLSPVIRPVDEGLCRQWVRHGLDDLVDIGNLDQLADAIRGAVGCADCLGFIVRASLFGNPRKEEIRFMLLRKL